MKHFSNCRVWRTGYYPFRPHTIEIGDRRSDVPYGYIRIPEYCERYNMRAYATATDSLGYEYIVYADETLERMAAFPTDIYGSTPNEGQHKDMKYFDQMTT